VRQHIEQGAPLPHPFLSPEWFDEVHAIRDRYADGAPSTAPQIRMNQIITGAPFGDDDIKLYVDTSQGAMMLERGELESPDVTVTTDYETARKVLVDQDAAAGMQAFMSGKIKVQGDMAKLMAMQASPPDDVARQIADAIKDVTA
jgi:SCP-2 sterol transfer family